MPSENYILFKKTDQIHKEKKWYQETLVNYKYTNWTVT